MIERNISRAVITGPTGAIGTALCLELAQKGIRVFAVCRPDTPRAAQIPQHKNIEKIFCDLSQLTELPNLIHGGADAFYHFGWAHTIGSGRNDMPAQIQNIRHTIDAVQAAAKLGCQVFVGAGSQAEYGPAGGVLRPETPCNPTNGYGIAKLCAGNMSRVECAKLGLDHIWIRILSVYGPNDTSLSVISGVIRQLLSGQTPKLTAGEQMWDYLYAADAATAFRLAALHGVSQKTYVLGSGTARPLKEYIITLRDQIDPSLPLGFGQIPYGQGQVMHLQADISALQQDTGFTPQVDFARGIRRTIDAIKEAL